MNKAASKQLGYKTAAQALLTVAGLLVLGGCGQGNKTAQEQTDQVVAEDHSDDFGHLQNHLHAPVLAPPARPDAHNVAPLRELRGAKPRLPLQTLSMTPNTNVVALKVLVLSANAYDGTQSAATTMLAQAGVPYDVINPSVSGSFTAQTLVAEDGTGKYQGVILTTGNLAYEASPGVWQSALDWAGWNLLWQYEQDYKVRQVSLYTYPSSWPEEYGLRDAGLASATANPKLTAAGSGVFTDLRPGVTLPIQYAYNYPATVAAVPGVTTTPLFTDAGGRVLAARSDTAGRERLALTFAQNPNLLHSELLGYSLVKWLTKGVHLGEYRRFNQLDIDDWFLPGDLYNATTKTIKPDAFRISASDALSLSAQQTSLRQRYPVSSEFKFAIVYNGGGANTAAPLSCATNAVSPDRLSSMSRCLANSFDWVSHTRDHLYMDFLNYSDSFAQLQPNLTIGAQLGLNISTKSLVTGDMSGLGYYNPAGEGPKTDFGLLKSNASFLSAAQNTGTRYLSSNRSVSSQWDAGCINCGLVHPLNPNIFLIPRWPTNVFYHVTTPTQAVTAYNGVYGPTGTAPYWPTDLTYNQYLDKETDLALGHVLSGSAYPHYMHQGNLRQHTTGRSLASDWESALLTKYSKYSTLPLKTLRWDSLGAYIEARTSYMKSGMSGTWNRAAKTLTVQSASGGEGFVTGAAGSLGSSEVYGGHTITTFALGAGQLVTAVLP
ncbi:hypothetical protein [Deinococcus sp. QL22]|uniref:Agd3-related carbohydrate-binding protein n=1 Tax=Deinococcus sp. QL22 TaxID=2939437 RepID=UPI002017A400|nr:hypothetical protein [Deinococcus sp. QL22]UQN09869.1 hypothetical protein M1R55_27240 [Deinococcus sp. QL22]